MSFVNKGQGKKGEKVIQKPTGIQNQMGSHKIS